MRKRMSSGLLIGVVAAATAFAQAPADRFMREVVLEPRSQDELRSIRLDVDIFAASQDGFVDLRLLDDRQAPIPHLVRKVRASREHTARRIVAPERVDAVPQADGGLELTLRVPADAPPIEGFRLVTPLVDFEQRVRALVSDDGTTWRPLGEETAVFDYARYVDVRNDSLTFPSTDGKRLRIVIDDVTVEQQSQLTTLTKRLRAGVETDREERTVVTRRPFRIDRVELWGVVRQERADHDETASYAAAGFRVEHDAEHKRTIVHVASRREPLTSLTIRTPERNFSRRATLEAPVVGGSNGAWRPIAQGPLTRIDFGTVHREQLTLTFPETRCMEYRLVIDDRDARPLEIAGIATGGNVYEALFLVAAAQEARLFYGADRTTAATYDTAVLDELLKAGNLAKPAELGPPTPLDGAPADDPGWTSWLNRPLVPSVVGIGLVLLLGWGLYHAGRRVDALPRHEQGP